MISDQDIYRRGAIRSKIVARLSGASLRQISYWHRTNLIRATVVKGQRGIPRLYSWIDYMKVRAAVKLLTHHVPNGRLRFYIDWLERNEPEWYRYPLIPFEGRVFVERGNRFAYEAAPERQAVMAGLVWSVLSELTREGPLGLLSRTQTLFLWTLRSKLGVQLLEALGLKPSSSRGS